MSQLNSSAPHIHNATGFEDVVDWGPQPDLLEGASHSTGRLLHKGPDNIPETIPENTSKDSTKTSSKDSTKTTSKDSTKTTSKDFSETMSETMSETISDILPFTMKKGSKKKFLLEVTAL